MKIFITNIKSSDVRELECGNLEMLEKVIKSIKSHHFDMNTYEVEATEDVRDYLTKKYNPRFYEFDFHKRRYKFKKLPNGVKRSISRPRKVNNEKRFKALKQRMKGDLYKELEEDGNDWAVVINAHNGDEDALRCRLKFYFVAHDGFKGQVQVEFDKIKWSYTMISILSEKYYEYVQRIVKSTLNKRTSSTRKYRARKNANNS